MQKWLDMAMLKLQGWWEQFTRLVPNIVVALLVILIAIFLGRIFRRLLYRTTVVRSGKSSISMLIAKIMQIATIILGFFIALDVLQLNKAFTSLLAGAGIIGIILGFAFQDIAANFIAGMYIALKKPFEIGHTVKTNDHIGNIEEIQLRSTVIRTFSGLHVMIPNRDIIQKPIINYSLTLERRIELEFFIDADQDLSMTHRVAMYAMKRIDYVFPGKPVEIYFNDFRANSVKMVVWFWINNHRPPGYMVARHDAILYISQALQEKGISLVVPISMSNILQPQQ